MISIALYPIYVPEVVHPHYTIQKSFESHFFPCYTFDWVKRMQKSNLRTAQQEFIQLVKEKRPDYAFMQIQNPLSMDVETIRELSKYTKVINWSGDVRSAEEWYKWFEVIGQEIYLTLFSNMTDVEIMRERGVRADYLQVGYDHNIYYPAKAPDGPEIVFSAHYHSQFPLSKYRVEVARALTTEFKHRFQLYGNGWDRVGLKAKYLTCQQEAEVYRSAKIGISVSNFNYKRYHSDRLLRILGSGCLALSHNFEGVKEDYPIGVKVFDTIDDLIGDCHFFLEHEDVRRVCLHGSVETAQKKYTWEYRCKELIQLMEKYD